MTERLRDQERGFRKQAIALAAAEVLADSDCRAFTMTDVAERLRTSKATLYRYFPSREALIRAVVEPSGRTTVERVSTAGALPESPSPGAGVAHFLARSLLDRSEDARPCCLIEIECPFWDWGVFDVALNTQVSPGGNDGAGLGRSVRALSAARAAQAAAEGRMTTPADVSAVVGILFPDAPGSGS